MPGFLFELLCSFLFFRRHGRFLLFFPVIFSFFCHDVYFVELIDYLNARYSRNLAA